VFENLEREMKRIQYQDMLVKGVVRMVRRRVGGGYFTILTPPRQENANGTSRVAYRSRFVHLAIGYPGLRFLPDLQAFREASGDYEHVVNAYEPHEHVYEFLKTRPGTVLVRGGGIVASRVLNRLFDDREKFGLQTKVVHLFRTFVTGAHGPHVWMRRKGGDGWAYQGFNYPKSVWGGQLKAEMRKLDGEARAKKYQEMGGTNTPKRRRWQKQMANGRKGGYYHAIQGTVEKVTTGPDGMLTSLVTSTSGAQEIHSHYIIDCTGLEADISEHRVLADLLAHGGAERNPLGRLEVERHFEVKGTRSGDGALYASGATTLGGYFPGVDTFLGLQVAAQEIADDLARHGFAKKIGPARSVAQWFKWAFNRPV
jgi:lysine/ornithine N-monooxygenase